MSLLKRLGCEKCRGYSETASLQLFLQNFAGRIARIIVLKPKDIILNISRVFSIMNIVLYLVILVTVAFGSPLYLKKENVVPDYSEEGLTRTLIKFFLIGKKVDLDHFVLYVYNG